MEQSTGRGEQASLESLGETITRDRRAAGLSVTRVAAQTGLGRSTLYRIERDAVQNRPSPASLAKIARVLGTRIEDYFALAGYITPCSLPGLRPYLQAKYDVSEQVASQVEDFFQSLHRQDSGPLGQQQTSSACEAWEVE